MFRTAIRSTRSCHTTSPFRSGLAIVALAATTALAIATGSALAAAVRAAPPIIAMIGEPQTLDPMASTADLVGIDHAARLRTAVHLRCQLERGADAGGEHAGDLEGRPRLHAFRCARASSSTTARR